MVSFNENDSGNDNHKFTNYSKRIIRRFSKCIQIARGNQSNNDNLVIGLRAYDQRHRVQHRPFFSLYISTLALNS